MMEVSLGQNADHLFKWRSVEMTWEQPMLIPGKEGEGRYYRLVDGTVLPSVTTVLKGKEDGAELAAWKARLGPQEAAKQTALSARRGKNMHTLAEKYLTTGSVRKTLTGEMPDMIGIFRNLRPILEKIDNIRAIELPIWSRILKIAGTIDCVGDYEGVPSIIDFKSAKGFKREEFIEGYVLQTTGYACMWMEQTGEPYKQLVIIVGAFEENAPQVFTYKVEAVNIAKLMKLIRQNSLDSTNGN